MIEALNSIQNVFNCIQKNSNESHNIPLCVGQDHTTKLVAPTQKCIFSFAQEES